MGLSSNALEWLFPSRCSLCGVVGLPPICDACRSQFETEGSPHSLCGPLDYRLSAYWYESRAAMAVKRLKFNRCSSLASPMAQDLAKLIFRHGWADGMLVVPIPIHWTRRAWRGFNQAELLCEAIPPEILRPQWLRRTRPTRPQTTLSREERARNLEGAFRASPEVAGRDILLVDDVVTTGQTAVQCAQALKEFGANEVSLVTFAVSRGCALR